MLGKAPTYRAVLLHMRTTVNIPQSLLQAQFSPCVLRRCLRKGWLWEQISIADNCTAYSRQSLLKKHSGNQAEPAGQTNLSNETASAPGRCHSQGQCNPSVSQRCHLTRIGGKDKGTAGKRAIRSKPLLQAHLVSV